MSERRRVIRKTVDYAVEGLASTPIKRKAMRLAREYDKAFPSFAPHRVYRVTTTTVRERIFK